MICAKQYPLHIIIIINIYEGLIIVCYCLRDESDFITQSRVLRSNNFTREYEIKTCTMFHCDFSTGHHHFNHYNRPVNNIGTCAVYN